MDFINGCINKLKTNIMNVIGKQLESYKDANENSEYLKRLKVASKILDLLVGLTAEESKRILDLTRDNLQTASVVTPLPDPAT